MRRWSIVLAVVLAPVVASGADFLCPQQAFDLSSCPDLSDLSTCAVQPLPEIPDLMRQALDQPILRLVDVLQGPHTDVRLSMVALNELADQTFTAARNRLCVPEPPPAPPPTTTPPPASTPAPPPGPIWYGPDPGIYLRR